MHSISPGQEKYQRDCEAAQEKAERFWKKSKTFGPVAIEPRLLELLNNEEKSIQKLFHVMAQMALSGKSDYIKQDGTPHGCRVIVEQGGGRRWDQRSLAATARMATGTVNVALRRLQELGLIVMDTSRKWGTYILIKCFERFTNRKTWRSAVGLGPKGSNFGVSMNGTFDLPPDKSSFINDHVHVQVPQKEGDSSQKTSISDKVRSDLSRIFPEVPSWA